MLLWLFGQSVHPGEYNDYVEQHDKWWFRFGNIVRNIWYGCLYEQWTHHVNDDESKSAYRYNNTAKTDGTVGNDICRILWIVQLFVIATIHCRIRLHNVQGVDGRYGFGKQFNLVRVFQRCNKHGDVGSEWWNRGRNNDDYRNV